MSTRARITFIVRGEGHRLEYSKHWDGYPYAVLGSLHAGTFTIEDLIKRWGLTEESEGFTEYYYEFDFRNMSMNCEKICISKRTLICPTHSPKRDSQCLQRKFTLSQQTSLERSND